MDFKGTEREALQTILGWARRRFAEGPSWLEFVDEVNATCRELLGDALSRFVGEEAREIHCMTIQLALKRACCQERMITVRLPRRLHDALKSEAGERATSLNCLAVAKLLQPLPGERDPATRQSNRQTVLADRKLTVDQPGLYLALYQPPGQRSHSVIAQVSGEAPMLQLDWAFTIGTKQATPITPRLLDLEFYNQLISFAESD